MKRYSRTSLSAAAGCTVLLSAGLVACGADTPPPPVPQDPPAAVAPAVPGDNAQSGDNAAAGEAAAGDAEADEAVRVCATADENQERLDDAACEEAIGDTDDPAVVQEVHYHNNGSGILTPLLWYYIGRSSASGAGPIIPAVGSSIANTGATNTPPKSGVIAKNVSRDARPFSESYRSAQKTTPAATTGGKKTGTQPGGNTPQDDKAKQATGAGNNKTNTGSGNTGDRNTGGTNTGGANTGDSANRDTGAKTNTGGNQSNGSNSGSKSGSKSGGFGGGKATGGHSGG